MLEPGPGILLIAEPFLKDPNFMRTVVLICEHQPEGTFGFVINKAFDHSLSELMNDMDDLDIPVFYGGPVQMDTIHFLHTVPDLIEGGVAVNNGIYWGGNFETAISLLRQGIINSDNIRFFLGYSGWGEGQLTDEMKEKSWLTGTANRKLVFKDATAEIWKNALKELGGDYELMINYPSDPQLN
jgi:putative transcriptional regulator